MAFREMVADQDAQLAHIRLIRAFFLELVGPRSSTDRTRVS